MSKKIDDIDLNKLAKEFDLPFKSIKAVQQVEAGGGGFRNDGYPKMLFEPAYFQKNTGGKFKSSHPNINRDKYDPSYYKQFPDAKKNFEEAYKLDPDSAIKSTSWGLGQIMGQNYKAAGFNNPSDMLEAFKKSEYEQTKGMLNFIKSSPAMFRALVNQEWAAFAKLYNGPAYKSNNYDTKLKAAFESAKDFITSDTGKKVIGVGFFFWIIIAIIVVIVYKVNNK